MATILPSAPPWWARQNTPDGGALRWQISPSVCAANHIDEWSTNNIARCSRPRASRSQLSAHCRAIRAIDSARYGGTASMSEDQSVAAVQLVCSSRNSSRPWSVCRSAGSLASFRSMGKRSTSSARDDSSAGSDRSAGSNAAAASGVAAGSARSRARLTGSGPGLPSSPAARGGRAGIGSSPRRRRRRTSCAVPRETLAIRAISRSGASGRWAIASAARCLPAVPFNGRRLPSAPTLVFNLGESSLERCRSAATVLAAKPLCRAIARSDRWGWVEMMRVAAVLRSAKVSGRPCEMFSSTARMNASSSLPSKNTASISSRPRRIAA
jgi:hypothetical protein